MILERCINNRTGTDGHRYIGRTCHLSLFISFSQAEMIFLSTATQPLLRLMSNDAQVQTPTGKYPLESGLVFFIALTRANHSEKLQGIITFL